MLPRMRRGQCYGIQTTRLHEECSRGGVAHAEPVSPASPYAPSTAAGESCRLWASGSWMPRSALF
jgi:hypothetical protein